MRQGLPGAFAARAPRHHNRARPGLALADILELAAKTQHEVFDLVQVRVAANIDKVQRLLRM